MSSFVFTIPSGPSLFRLGRVTLAFNHPFESGTETEQPVSANKEDTEAPASEFRAYQLHNDNAPDVRCEAKVLGQVNRPFMNLRSEIFTVLETKGGKKLAVKTGLSMVPGERSRQSVKVAESDADVVEFFGHGRLAKELYETINLDTTQQVD